MDKYVYEVLDTSDDEAYYTLGIFLSLEDAEKAIKEVESESESLSEYSEDYEEITIRKRKIGWSIQSPSVLVIRRGTFYDEGKDEYLWRRVGV